MKGFRSHHHPPSLDFSWRNVRKPAHMQTVGALSEAGQAQWEAEVLRENHILRRGRTIARRILRREIAEVDQRHATPPPPETE